MEYISLDKGISEIFNGIVEDINTFKLLSPDYILSLQQTKIENKILISNWEQFDCGIIDLSIEDFKDIIFQNSCFKDSNIEYFILTDELITSKLICKLVHGEFDEFVNEHEAKYGINFFEPSDYLVFLIELKKVIMIHHSGYYFECTL